MFEKKLLRKAVFCAVIVVAACAWQVAAQGVIKISSYEDLGKIGTGGSYPLDGRYELAKTIDASESRGLDDGKGHTPIGRFGVRGDTGATRLFTGTFDGMGNSIKGLYINRPGEDYIGLFGAIGPGATVKNVIIEADSVVGKNHVGVLAGRNAGTYGGNGGEIFECIAKGAVKGSNNVGGLVGYYINITLGALQSAGFEGTVSGDTAVGGVFGLCKSSVRYGGPGSTPGPQGLIDVYFKGTVTGVHGVGGVSGNHFGSMEKAQSEGAVSGISNVGGIIGLHSSHNMSPSIKSSHSTAAVKGEVAVGGLVGYSSGNGFEHNYATGKVSGKYCVGGLIGHMYQGYGIRGCYASGAVYGSDSAIGGLVGKIEYSRIDTCYAIGNVYGDTLKTRYAGGLVGKSDTSGISFSYAAGDVEADISVGGLVGKSSGPGVKMEYTTYGQITNSYAVGNVAGWNSLGGLVGVIDGGGIVIDSCYAVGAVRRVVNPSRLGWIVLDISIGGILGYNKNGGAISKSFYDTETSGQKIPVGHYMLSEDFQGVGGGPLMTNVSALSTADMKDYLSFKSVWDFVNVWNADGYYPYLRFFPVQKLTYKAGANGSVRGSREQVVNTGAAQAVVAVPDSGYVFDSWSDGVKTAGRTDRFASGDVTVSAVFRGEGVPVRYRHAGGGAFPLVTVRGKSLAINAAPGANVSVRVVNMTGRTVAVFKVVGRADCSLRKLPAGAYIVETKRDGGHRMTLPIVVR